VSDEKTYDERVAEAAERRATVSEAEKGGPEPDPDAEPDAYAREAAEVEVAKDEAVAEAEPEVEAGVDDVEAEADIETEDGSEV